MNKRVGPAQDVKLQSSSNDHFSSLSSSSTELNAASRFSNETPVTKLLGPAYKQTEKFLKDLQEAKLSYTNNESKFSVTEYDQSNIFPSKRTSRSSVLSRDESIQVGRSKLNINGSRSFPDSQENTHKQGNLTEQDISSASILDAETSKAYNKAGNRDDNEHSEGELLMSELSESLNRDVLSSDRGSRSSLSKTTNTTISQPSASLEPIKEVNSPNKSISRSHNRNERSFSHQHQEGDDENFAVDSMQHPISSTSTPCAEATASKQSIRGIYDIQDSTSPGSTNRRRLKRGETPKSRGNKPLSDPYNVYVSEDSRLTETSRVSSKQNIHLNNSTTHKSPSPGQKIVPEYTNNSTLNQRPSTIASPPLPPTNEVPKYHLPLQSRPSFSEASDVSSTTTTSLLTPKEKGKSLHGDLSTDENANHFDYTTATESKVSTPSKSVPKRSFVFPKQTNKGVNSDSSYHGNVSSTTNTDRSIEHEQMRAKAKSASLNELWESFEKSYRDASSSKSPLLKKLEVVSNLLKESRQRSLNHRHLLSDSSDVSSSYCESHTPFPSSRRCDIDVNKKATSVTSDVNFDYMRDADTKKHSPKPIQQSVCPICQRREIGTNMPTPRPSDREEDLPLTLQTWTQTSPYLIDNNQFTKYAQDLKTEHRKNLPRSIPAKKKPTLARKETYTVFSPKKSNRSRSSNNSNQRKKDVPYTAWFQSVRSDVSDIVPLCKIPELSTLYAESQDKKYMDNEKRYVYLLLGETLDYNIGA